MDINLEDRVISGRVLGIRDVVTFEGDTVAEAEQAFRDSVDDYLAFCSERGVSPEKPFSGKFIVRICPELHRTLAIAAESRKMSLNALVEEILSTSVAGPARPQDAGHPARKKSRLDAEAKKKTGRM